MNKMGTTRKQIRQAEHGFGMSIQTIWYSLLLFMMLGLVYDMGNVVYVQQVAQNSVIIAANELTKNIDQDRLIRYQEVKLTGVNAGAAQTIVDNLAERNFGSNGIVNVTNAYVDDTSYYPRSVVVVQASAIARMPVLSALTQLPYNGPLNVTLNVQASAQPAFGIDGEVSDTDQ
jgi:hypothetical protein